MFSFRLIKGYTHLARRFSSSVSIFVNGSAAAPNYTALLALKFSDINLNPLQTRSHILPLDISPPQWSNNRNPMIKSPLVHTDMEEPVGNVVKEIMDKITEMPAHDFELPMGNNGVGDEGIQAAVLIGIRRRKMKKHKLKKLRKKMKFEWAKVRQRRELRKEKAFQAVLISQIKEAEKFSAEHYVADKLRQANETPIPRFWKGKRLPEFIIREKMGLK